MTRQSDNLCSASGRLRTAARLGALLASLVFVVAVPACKQATPAAEDTQEATSGDTPAPNELPALELRDDTPDLLITWIDDKGDFHVVPKPSDVPQEGRSQVRVVVTTQTDGTGRLVYVADLTQKSPAGTYPVKTLTRAQWNELGAERRKVRMDELAKEMPEVPKAAGTAAGASEEPTEDEKKLNAKVRAVIYGADWCKPCHDAENYLKKLGVDVTKKDIEESRAARAEMQKKLASAGRMGASIPVIDVGGKILVGFSRPAVAQAVAAARKPETL